MSSIKKKRKKAMKKSNGFFSIVVIDNSMVFCILEWYILRYHKKGISVDYAEYLPYKIMKRTIIER